MIKYDKFIIWVIIFFAFSLALIYPKFYFSDLFTDLTSSTLSLNGNAKIAMLAQLAVSILHDFTINLFIGLWLLYISSVKNVDKYTWFLVGFCFSYNAIILYVIFYIFENKLECRTSYLRSLNSLKPFLLATIFFIILIGSILVLRFISIDELTKDSAIQLTYLGEFVKISQYFLRISLPIWLYISFRKVSHKITLWALFSFIAGSSAIVLFYLVSLGNYEENIINNKPKITP